MMSFDEITDLFLNLTLITVCVASWVILIGFVLLVLGVLPL